MFFMQAGFAMLCAGSVRRKNAQNTMLKNLLDACGAAVAFFCVGYGFAFGGAFFYFIIRVFLLLHLFSIELFQWTDTILFLFPLPVLNYFYR